MPAGRTIEQRESFRQYTGLRPGEQTHRSGLATTNLTRTVEDLAIHLAPDQLVCCVDSALRQGWAPTSPRRGSRQIQAACLRADRRSESAFEMLVRLLLTAAGLPPEVLQLEIFGRSGDLLARVDMAWPSVKLAVEADGRAYHESRAAFQRDRLRGNDLELEGWTVLRFTWAELHKRPQWVVAQVRRALQARANGR